MEWIKCEEELPHENQEVLFFYDGKIHSGLYYGKSNNNQYLWQSYIDSYNCVTGIDFWMRLPVPPEEKQ